METVDLAGVGYHTRPADALAVRALLARRNGIRALLLEGAPGTGKTFLAESLAKALGGEYLYLLGHHWLSDEELFLGVDVGAVAAGVARAEDAYRPGVLLRAVHATQAGQMAVVCIDELDKAPQRAETLLLDFLQSGTVHGPRGERWAADASKLVVVMTTNGVRPLMEATLRRAFRLTMTFLPEGVERDLLRRWTGAPKGAVRLVVQMATAIRAGGSTSPSLQEMRHLLEDMAVANGAQDAETLLRGWLSKGDEDWSSLVAVAKAPGAALWGEWVRG